MKSKNKVYSREVWKEANRELVMEHGHKGEWVSAVLIALTGQSSNPEGYAMRAFPVHYLYEIFKPMGLTIEKMVPLIKDLKETGLVKVVRQTPEEVEQMVRDFKHYKPKYSDGAQYLTLFPEGYFIGAMEVNARAEIVEKRIADKQEQEASLVRQYEETTQEWLNNAEEFKIHTLGLSARMHSF